MLNTASVLIDISALRHNLGVVRQLCPNSQVMAMVKADGYGHGLLRAADALATADGLAVARLQEAIQLRNAGISNRILLLGSILDASDLRFCGEANIDIAVHDMATVDLITVVAKNIPLRVWLKLDSGMHRLGLDAKEFCLANQILQANPGVLEIVHMTHFSSADDLTSTATDKQLLAFMALHNINSKAKVSIANSAALISRPETHADWVRPGIMLYGENPLASSYPLPLRPAMTLRSRVLAVRQLDAGEAVGYGCTWTSKRISRIATIGIGYGDGYPRHAGCGTPVWINGQIAPLVGRVSMDSITIDVTDCKPATVGDEVTLWGEVLPAAIIARNSHTIPYQLFTSISGRPNRVYIDSY
jgi:alanine racemase